jgi:hypothetical protein
MSHSRRALGCALLLVITAAAPAFAARVESFAPQGTAKKVRQVSVRFSEPMIPLGDPRSPDDPFAIACSEPGTSRWADPQTWVFNFAEDLPAGVSCRFTLAADLRTLSGAKIDGQRDFSFSTGGPAVTNSAPWSRIIDEDQRFAFRLDAPATRESIEAHAVIRVAGLPDPIGLRVVEGGDRDAILESLDWKTDDPRIVVLEARQRFAPGEKLTLNWGPGIATTSGVATEQEQLFEYEVRPPFTARLWCERENEKAACVPLKQFSLSFSSAVPWETASRIVLRQLPDGAAPARTWTARRGDPGDGDPLVNYLIFDAPFPPRAKFAIEMPAELRDDAGRALDASQSTIEVATDRYPPLAKFSAKFGVVESASPVLPVALRHVGADATLRGVDVSGSMAARSAHVAADEPRAILAWLNALVTTDETRSPSGPGGCPRRPGGCSPPRRGRGRW